MTDQKKRTALLSAYRKDDELAEFARQLAELGFNLLASSGTALFLLERGIFSQDIADLVGKPMLGRRVVTLSQEVHAGLLARRDDPDDLIELESRDMRPFDLVYVDFYPLADELRKQAESFMPSILAVIEKIDIGGPTLLQSAAKGGRYAVSSPDQYNLVIRHLQSQPTEIEDEQRFKAGLAATALHHVVKYLEHEAKFYTSVANGSFFHR